MHWHVMNQTNGNVGMGTPPRNKWECIRIAKDVRGSTIGLAKYAELYRIYPYLTASYVFGGSSFCCFVMDCNIYSYEY